MVNSQPTILPGQTVGILGGGQLGRMLAMAARRHGYRVAVFTPEDRSPASHFANGVTRASFDDLNALKQFADQVDVITFEFENVPVDPLRSIENSCLLRPGLDVFETVRSRANEKTFLAQHGISCAPFCVVTNHDELITSVAEVPLPAVLKLSGGGYDGKGQVIVRHADELLAAWHALGKQPATIESLIDLACEISVLVCRDRWGGCEAFGPIENHHTHHILDWSLVPARISPSVHDQAIEISRTVAEKLDLVGLICVEFFVDRSGTVMVNEIAPRPHNSGHLTIEATFNSQFDQQLRTICGLPVVPFGRQQPAAMANLLGDAWQGGTPDWGAASRFGNVKLHLYDKSDPVPGRKMGHLTSTGEMAEQALADVLAARTSLTERV